MADPNRYVDPMRNTLLEVRGCVAGCSVALAVALGVSSTAHARQTGSPANDVLERLAAIEAENRELSARIEQLEYGGSGSSLFGNDVSATVRLFGDVGGETESPPVSGESNSSFALGSVDFFVLAQLSEDFRALSETFISSSSGDNVSFSQERLWLAWTRYDELQLKIGTEHGPVSRWNQLYHHGRWLETSATRPIPVRFEGDGGILPLHRTGIEASGGLHFDAGRLEYYVMLSNGRGSSPTSKQRASDANDDKALDVGLAFEPFAVPDLRVGLGVLTDRIPISPTAAPGSDGTRTIPETIYSFQLESRFGRFESIAEYFVIEHEGLVTRRDFNSTAGYVQLALPSAATEGPRFTPYVRFEDRNMRLGDPFYSALGRDLDAYRTVLGTRLDLGENLALKFEVGYGQSETRTGVVPVVQEENVFTTAFQVAWWL